MTRNRLRTNAAVVAIALVVAGVAGTAPALITETDIEGRIVDHEVIRHVTIDDSDIERSSIRAASLDGSYVGFALLEDVSIHESYLNDLTIRRALVEDSRVNRATLEDVTLKDATVCNVSVNERFHTGQCQLVSIESGNTDVFAKMTDDAPETIAPGDSYDIRVKDAVGDSLTVTNAPGGLVGLNFETAQDPLGLQSLGFEAAADASSVDSFELIVDGETVATFGFNETVELPSEGFTLRVNTAASGIIDGARLGLVLDLDGHELRPQITQFDVVATSLAFLPIDQQPFAPFIADDVARLIVSVPTDDNGNVDRDVNVTTSVDVTSVDSEGVELVSDIDDQVRLHDDSRIFSTAPFLYMQTVLAAHHPQTLELLVRGDLPIPVDYGTIDFYGTHVVGLSPFEKNITITGETVNANGETLTAEIDLTMPATPDEARQITALGQEFTLPGRGTLQANFVDANGDPVAAEDDWSLFIQETPTSHQVSMSIDLDGGQTSAEQELAGSAIVGTPFGNFVPSAYKVCVDHDGERDCALGGDLVTIQTGETTSVDIVVG